jgi:hypothetical protein
MTCELLHLARLCICACSFGFEGDVVDPVARRGAYYITAAFVAFVNAGFFASVNTQAE